MIRTHIGFTLIYISNHHNHYFVYIDEGNSNTLCQPYCQNIVDTHISSPPVLGHHNCTVQLTAFSSSAKSISLLPLFLHKITILIQNPAAVVVAMRLPLAEGVGEPTNSGNRPNFMPHGLGSASFSGYFPSSSPVGPLLCLTFDNYNIIWESLQTLKLGAQDKLFSSFHKSNAHSNNIQQFLSCSISGTLCTWISLFWDDHLVRMRIWSTFTHSIICE